MGQIFELIADNALEKLDDYYTECHVCNKTDSNLFQYHGKCEFENGEIDNDIYAVCADCISSKNLSHICDFEYIKTITNYLSNRGLTIQELDELKTKLVEKYQKTPDIPSFSQTQDRPLCCNDLTEFIGYPINDKDLYEKTKNCIYWEYGKEFISSPYDFKDSGSPESLTEIATFKCSHCEKKYFTFQFT